MGTPLLRGGGREMGNAFIIKLKFRHVKHFMSAAAGVHRLETGSAGARRSPSPEDSMAFRRADDNVTPGSSNGRNKMVRWTRGGISIGFSRIKTREKEPTKQKSRLRSNFGYWIIFSSPKMAYFNNEYFIFHDGCHQRRMLCVSPM